MNLVIEVSSGDSSDSGETVFFCETGDSDESGDSSDSGYYGYSDRKCDIWLTNNASKKAKRF